MDITELDPTDDCITADCMSGVPIAESDAVPSVVPAAHQTHCTEGTENDIGLVPALMTVLESEVQQNEIPVVQCPAHGIASQHSSGKKMPIAQEAPAKKVHDTQPLFCRPPKTTYQLHHKVS